ncbi:hypothetical protein GCM10009807_24580 [Microbacterium lacus]|uniref:Tripartite ATP-independent periplasmic transporters DctQ component domain-containing protein n=1 Tax=Microbacterium lacus TaxID=415217 RepID=A0ABP4SZF9_9MICO
MEYVAAIGIILMTIHVLANVFTRTVFGQPMRGTNEIVGYLWLPAIVMIGIVVSVVRGQTIEADIIYQKFPRQIRREVRLFTSALSAAVSLGFAWYGLQESIHALQIGEKAPASDVYVAPITLLPPLAFATLAVLFTIDALRAIRGRFDDEGFGLLDTSGPDLLKDANRD